MAAVGSREIRVAKLLLASGRAPNVEALRLDELGIEHDRAGILVDELMRTSVDGIWAAGDVTGRYQFTPIAQYQARIAIDDMFGRDPAPGGLFGAPDRDLHRSRSWPAVGLTEQEAREQGIEHEVVMHDIEARPALVLQGPEARPVQDRLRDGTRDASSGCTSSRRTAPTSSTASRSRSGSGVTVDDLAALHHIFPTFAEGVKAAAEQAMPQPVEMAAICN